MLLPLLLLPVLSTLAGGLLALRFRRFGPALMALAAGLLLGAAFLDLLPEALDLGAHAGLPAVELLGWALVAFLVFSILESVLDHFGAEPHDLQTVSGSSPREGLLSRRVGGLLLVFHSFRDGMAIGAAYAASHPMGYAVALGIIVHDLGDGMNTILVTTRGHSPRRGAYAFLAADALAPVLGGMLTAWWMLGPRPGAILLAASAGFFLQMATSEFLPQIRTQRQRRPMLYALVAAGSAILFVANRLLGL